MRLMHHIAAVGILAACMAHPCLACEVLFSLDFEEPTHHAGLPPARGSTPGKVSSIPFGQPGVVDSMPLLDGNSLEFEGHATYEQIQLSIPDFFQNADAFGIGFDIVTVGLRNSAYQMVVLLDTPEVRNLVFDGATASINVYHPGIPYTFTGLQTFESNQRYHIEMAIDLVNDRWIISNDEIRIFDDAIIASRLRSVRFSLAPELRGTPSNPEIRAYLDNIIVMTPEPSALPGVFLFALPFRRLRSGFPDRADRE